MDWINQKEEILAFLKKYRLAALVLLVGLLLMLVPEQTEAQPATATQQPQEETAGLQQELEEILSRLEGAGKVKVLLSEAMGEEILYQTDLDQNKQTDSQDQRRDTVIISQSDRSESGLIQRIDPPVYLGAVVLCQGADSAAVRLAVVDAVGVITGLSSDKIAVLKMK